MRQDHDAALDSINNALHHLPSLGNRGSHKLLHEQCLSKRDVSVEGRLRASLDTEYRCRLEEREAEPDKATLNPGDQPRHGSMGRGTCRRVHRSAGSSQTCARSG